jgi:hypothetical protein
MISYPDIFRAVALRTGQLTGGNTSARESAFAHIAPSTQTDGIDLPPSAIRQDVLMRERELVQAIGNSDSPILRATLMAASGNIAYGDEVPFEDLNGNAFFGKLDGIFSTSDDRSLTEATKEEIDNYVDNPGGFFKVRPYHFCQIGTIVFHTRDTAYFRGVSWDLVTQTTAYDADGDSPLHEGLEGLWVDMVCAGCPQEGWFMPEAGYYAQRARAQWALFFPGQPMPDTRARAYPAKD